MHIRPRSKRLRRSFQSSVWSLKTTATARKLKYRWGGDGEKFRTASFNVLYWPLRVFARGAYAALPARGDSPVDVVPVDYVADASFALSQAPEAEGATFHLTAGADASSVGELVELASAFFKRPAPRLIDPTLYRRVLHPLLVRGARDERHRHSLAAQRDVLPVFRMNVTYDDRRARVALRAAPGSADAAAHVLRPAGAVRARRRLGPGASFRARDRGTGVTAPARSGAAGARSARRRRAAQRDGLELVPAG